MNKRHQKSLAVRMSIALAAALITGALVMALREYLNACGNEDLWTGIYRFFFADITSDVSAVGLFYLIGQLFIRALSLIIVPMTFTSLVLAIIRMLGATGWVGNDPDGAI